MDHRKLTRFGEIVIGALVGANVLHLLWTVWLTWEQIETGWDYGTNIEMLALLPWLTELICLPELAMGVVYMVMCLFKPHSGKRLAAVAIAFGAAVLQFVVTNLFMYF